MAPLLIAQSMSLNNEVVFPSNFFFAASMSIVRYNLSICTEYWTADVT
jgi:hypothetical protein